MTEKQFLIVGALLVVLFVGLFGFLSYREYQAYEALKAEVAGLDQQITTLTDKINKIKSLKAELEVLNQRFEKARKILPSDKELEGLITILNHLCKQTNMDYPRSLSKVKSKTRGRAAAGDIEEILYDVELRGTFFNFVKFVNWLEHYKRHMRLRSFSITGGGTKDSAKGLLEAGAVEYKQELRFAVQMATYRYTGKSGESTEESELRVEDSPIDEGARIDLEAHGKRDPFIFALTPTDDEEGPTGPGGEEIIEHDELLAALKVKLEEAKKLRHDVRKAPQIHTVSNYWDIVKRFESLTAWSGDQKPKHEDTKDFHDRLQAVIADIAGKMEGIITRLIGKRLDQVLAAADEAIEARRFGDAVGPLLAFLGEFNDFEIPEGSFTGLGQIFDKVFQALTALVEEENAYRETVGLIEKIEEAIAPYTKRRGRQGKLFADFVERLREVKEKAQNIKEFRGLGMIVSGLIWVPDESGRICIVESGNVRQASARQRRIFVEGEVIGTVKDETDTIRISKITQFKSVEFEFRGLKISQPLGDPAKKDAK